MTGLVTTIIPVYNRAGMVGEALKSVLDQTYRPIEVILVDDGSTDGTWNELQTLKKLYPDIVRIIQRENGGPGLARETGRLLAQGEFMQYFDSDDILLPRKFELQVAALRMNLDCDIAYCRSGVINAEGEMLYEPCKWTGRKMEALFPALLVDRWWNTHTPLYRKSLCDEMGAWPKQRPEDWDYDARAGALGAKLAFCDELLSLQRWHDGDRVSAGKMDAYHVEEAWFLPRLYGYATSAGVAIDSPEMAHFSRWAFSHVRHAVRRGDYLSAEEMLKLSEQAGNRCFDFRIFKSVKNIFSFDIACWLYEVVRLMRREKKSARSMVTSWERPKEVS